MLRMSVQFSIITPSLGRRPKALALALESVATSLAHARGTGLQLEAEMLIGFDGHRPETFVPPEFVRSFNFPFRGSFGNEIRDALLKLARGERVLFLDDDNAFAPEALAVFSRHMAEDLVIARIDTSRAFAEPYLPRTLPSGERVAQGNVDPLCLSVRTEFARNWGRGWENKGGYESDYLNILRYYRRAASVVFLDDVVGVYDAGRGLDETGVNPRQAVACDVVRAGKELPSAAPWRTHG